MAINWDFQEPWPCAANNSLINYPSNPKPAYYHVSKSLRPVLASARVPKFRWEAGDTFSCELFLLNDTFNAIPAGKMTAKLVYDGNQEMTFYTWNFDSTDGSKNIAGPTASVVMPVMKQNLFKLVLQVSGRPDLTSEYTFVYRGKEVVNVKPDSKYLAGIFE